MLKFERDSKAFGAKWQFFYCSIVSQFPAETWAQRNWTKPNIEKWPESLGMPNVGCYRDFRNWKGPQEGKYASFHLERKRRKENNSSIAQFFRLTPQMSWTLQFALGKVGKSYRKIVKFRRRRCFKEILILHSNFKNLQNNSKEMSSYLAKIILSTFFVGKMSIVQYRTKNSRHYWQLDKKPYGISWRSFAIEN